MDFPVRHSPVTDQRGTEKDRANGQYFCEMIRGRIEASKTKREASPES
jgi:hypothetical protein